MSISAGEALGFFRADTAGNYLAGALASVTFEMIKRHGASLP